ncbi:MAG: hypothetical protein ISS33_02070 [Candidatus Omnitrophica bacterium]|nr:hypothetical protein [Candidatus Omnitrophota bacterium]
MISRISGAILGETDGALFISAGDLCYEVLVPLAIMKVIKNGGEVNPEAENERKRKIDLVTYHYYQMEPSRAIPVLIGFSNEIEKEFFEKFISVSGVGPKAACRALAEPISAIAGAIDSGDVAFLKKLPGIGQQRARLIVAKLQGKVGKFGLIQDGRKEAPDEKYSNIKYEAIEVLLQLQYKRQEAENMIRKASERQPEIKTSEELLNEVYKGRMTDK